MASPVEFRYYMRKFTLEDAAQNIQPIRLTTNQGKVELYVPPILQYRYQQRLLVNGAERREWSLWDSVPVIKEGEGGEDAFIAGDSIGLITSTTKQ